MLRLANPVIVFTRHSELVLPTSTDDERTLRGFLNSIVPSLNKDWTPCIRALKQLFPNSRDYCIERFMGKISPHKIEDPALLLQMRSVWDRQTFVAANLYLRHQVKLLQKLCLAIVIAISFG